jgi:hypothetical protein
LPGAAVAELIQLGEVVAGVDIQQRQRQFGRAEGLLGEPQEADGVLPAGEEQGGPLKFTRHLAHEVDGLGFEVLQVVEVVGSHQPGGGNLGSGVGGLQGSVVSGSRGARRLPRPDVFKWIAHDFALVTDLGS